MEAANGIFQNVTSGITASQPMVVDAISYSTLKSLNYFYYPICFAINVFGTLTNVVNIVAFYKIGLKDVVNFSFFILAVSDLFYSFLMAFFVNGVLTVSLAYPRELWVADIFAYAVCFTFYSAVFKDTTVVITAYISVARCCLVALPLQFKGIFTSSRTHTILVSIVILMILIHLPILFTQGVGWALDPITNTSRLYIWQLDARKYALEYNDIVNKNIVPNTALAVIIISLVIMSIKLAAASRFRRHMSSSGDHHAEKDLEKSASNASFYQLSPRELRVVKAVCSVAALYVFSTVPLVLQSVTRLILPEFNFGKTLQNTYRFSLVFTSTVGNFNSAFNFLLYFKYNRKFREVLSARCFRIQ